MNSYFIYISDSLFLLFRVNLRLCFLNINLYKSITWSLGIVYWQKYKRKQLKVLHKKLLQINTCKTIFWTSLLAKVVVEYLGTLWIEWASSCVKSFTGSKPGQHYIHVSNTMQWWCMDNKGTICCQWTMLLSTWEHHLSLRVIKSFEMTVVTCISGGQQLTLRPRDPWYKYTFPRFFDT